jgi:hypothetical protein
VQSQPPRSVNQPATETETLDTPWQASPHAMPTKSSVSASNPRRLARLADSTAPAAVARKGRRGLERWQLRRAAVVGQLNVAERRAAMALEAIRPAALRDLDDVADDPLAKDADRLGKIQQIVHQGRVRMRSGTSNPSAPRNKPMTAIDRRAFIAVATIGIAFMPVAARSAPLAMGGLAAKPEFPVVQSQWHGPPPPHRHRHRRRVCWWHRGRRVCGWR